MVRMGTRADGKKGICAGRTSTIYRGIMKEKFTDSLRLLSGNIQRLEEINEIIEEYRVQGYRLTLRQLYYQLVSRGIIPNEVKEYAKIGDILVKGRMAGIVDWDAIEDRVRVPRIPYYAANPADAIDDITRQYRLDRMRDQDVYLEVWVEKDALSGVLSRITEKYHVRLMVNRGYSSASAMYDASKRFLRHPDKVSHILYLGDHDPSGVDMVRDIGKRLGEFGAEVKIHHIALTDHQIEKYNPPPNPAKVSDPRAKDYIAKYGKTSWEVDALPPKVLNGLVEESILMLIDRVKYSNILEKEKEDIEKLKEIAGEMDD